MGDAPRATEQPDNSEARAALAAVHAIISTCYRCALSQTRTHTVPGEGALTSVIMFIGEGPGREEDLQGRPFVGRSGKFLDGMLAEQNIARESVFITSVVKCRPPGNRDPEPDELAACRDYMDQQIQIINPKIIVTLGRISMQRWFPGASITKIHGQPKAIEKGRIAMPFFHPAAALRNPAWRAAFAADMAKLPIMRDAVERGAAPDEIIRLVQESAT